MKQSIIDSIKLIEDGFASLVGRIKELQSLPENQLRELNHTIERIEKLSKYTEKELNAFVEYLQQLSAQTENELNDFVETLKQLPKQSENQLRDHLKTLKYLPKYNKKDVMAFVDNLRSFPEYTKEELNALMEYLKSFSERKTEEANTILESIKRLPDCTIKEAKELIKKVENKELPTHIKEGLIVLIERITLIKRLKFMESIKHLGKESQEELITLTDLIRKHISNYGMIILFGSYARGEQVVYDEKIVNGVFTTYQSDFDILIVMKNTLSKDSKYGVERKLDGIVTEQYEEIFSDRLPAPPQFIVENVITVSGNLKRKQPFFTDIIREGIVLYDSGEISLPEPQELPLKERMEIAQEQFDQCVGYADRFLKHGYYAYNDSEYKMAAFQLHQACENYYCAMLMVFDNDNPKLHNLKKLITRTKGYSMDLVTVFPLNSDFEKRCFELLYEAYTRARYDSRYIVTKEELEYMLERVGILKMFAHRLCHERLDYYAQKCEA